MMGIKIRNFAPLPDLSLEEPVPNDNFFRRLEERLDLPFVRELIEVPKVTEALRARFWHFWHPVG
jgi:hypothetical protein